MDYYVDAWTNLWDNFVLKKLIVCKAHTKRLRRVNMMNLLSCIKIKINNALIIEYVMIKTFMFNHVSGVLGKVNAQFNRNL